MTRINTLYTQPIFRGIVTAAAIKGGVGKTTIIHNLVIEYSKSQKVSVVDLDKNKSLTTGLAIRKQITPEKFNNISIFSVDSPQELLEIMQNNEREKGLLFIDQGGFDLTINRIATAGSDVLLTAMNGSFYELQGFKRFSQILSEINKEFRVQHGQELSASVVLCGIHPRSGEPSLKQLRSFVEREQNFSTMKTPIKTFDAYAISPGIGESVVEYESKGSAAENFLNFKEEIDEILDLQ